MGKSHVQCPNCQKELDRRENPHENGRFQNLYKCPYCLREYLGMQSEFLVEVTPGWTEYDEAFNAVDACSAIAP